jgi:hypothetical protein
MNAVAGERSPGAVGARIYSRWFLRIYDLGVLGFNNHITWRCPTSRILAHYDEFLSGNHLEAAVGTGWYLDHCQFPVPDPRIGLIDLNEGTLQTASTRLRRYAPETHLADLLEPVDVQTEPFDSLGLCYLLHCLPVDPSQKVQVVSNLRSLLNPGAVVFGATILGDQAEHNTVGRLMMWGLNRTGVFSNRDDTVEILTAGLEEHLDQVSVEIVGRVALFAGRLPAGSDEG